MFLILAVTAHFFSYFRWDLGVAHTLQEYLLPQALGFMKLVSLAGNGWIPHLLTALTALALLFWGWRAAAGALVLSAGGSALLNSLLKWQIGRPRPTAPDVAVAGHFGFLSFPSGHVTFYVCFFGFLFLLAQEHWPLVRGRRLILAALALPVLLIGLSRILLGAHWPSDTLGAYLWGSLWLGLAWELYGLWETPPDDATNSSSMVE